jgi:hypothetical protein
MLPVPIHKEGRRYLKKISGLTAAATLLGERAASVEGVVDVDADVCRLKKNQIIND